MIEHNFEELKMEITKVGTLTQDEMLPSPKFIHLSTLSIA
jgi:hypothetical protein